VCRVRYVYARAPRCCVSRGGCVALWPCEGHIEEKKGLLYNMMEQKYEFKINSFPSQSKKERQASIRVDPSPRCAANLVRYRMLLFHKDTITTTSEPHLSERRRKSCRRRRVAHSDCDAQRTICSRSSLLVIQHVLYSAHRIRSGRV